MNRLDNIHFGDVAVVVPSDQGSVEPVLQTLP
jgi:hypothetical protein